MKAKHSKYKANPRHLKQCQGSPLTRAAALLAAVSMSLSMSVSAFAADFWIGDGDITITVKEDGSQDVWQNGTTTNVKEGEEVVIKGGSSNAVQSDDVDDTFAIVAEDENEQPVDDTNEAEDETEGNEDAEGGENADENGEPEEENPEEEGEEETPAEENKAENPEEPAAEGEADGEEAGEQPEENKEQDAATQENAVPEQPLAAAPAAEEAVEQQADAANKDTFFSNVIKIINNVADKVAKVTLDNVKISGGGNPAMSIQGTGDVELELDGDNELRSYNYAGLEKNDHDSSGTLTIKDDNGKAGSLTAIGEGQGCAGIGGHGYSKSTNISDAHSSNITITGGTITAIGGYESAGIGGGGIYGNGNNITITGGTVTATGGRGGAGIGGGGYWGTCWGDPSNSVGNGTNITITGGTVTATGGVGAAGIGGGHESIGRNITVSGDAKVTAIAVREERTDDSVGASIGDGGNWWQTGTWNPTQGAGGVGTADISGLYEGGYIHHIYANGEEYWEYGTVTPPTSETAETATLPLHVENLFGTELAYTSARDGGTLTLTVNDAFARLHGSLAAVRELQAQGVSTIVFVTTMQTTTVSVSDLLARGADSDEFALRHDGVLSTLAVGNEILPAPCAK